MKLLLSLFLTISTFSLMAQETTILYFTESGIYAGPPAKSRQKHIECAAIKNGIVTSWDDMVKSLTTGLKTQGISLKEQAVLAVVPTTFSKEEHQQLAQLMFKQLGVSRYAATFDGACAVLATGKNSGLAIMMNTGGTQVVPIYEGIPVFEAIGHVNGKETLAQTTYNSLQKLNEKQRNLAISAAIVEGPAMVDGTPYQLNQDLKKLAPESMTLTYLAPPTMKLNAENTAVSTVFKGASNLESLSTFEEMWISIKEFDGKGTDAINRFFR